MHNLLKNALVTKVTTDGTNYRNAAGTTDTLNGGEIDMLGYDSVLIIAMLGPIAANGTCTGSLKNSATSATYGAGTIDLIGTTLVNAADTDDDKFLAWEVHRPQKRYLRLTLTRATGNVTIDAVLVIRYNAHDNPVTQQTTIGGINASQVLVSPTPSAT